MTDRETNISELKSQAYAIAWSEFSKIDTTTPDEALYGPDRLRWYIKIMMEAGERDPQKIANAALGMLREYEQILRSKACVEGQTAFASAA